MGVLCGSVSVFCFASFSCSYYCCFWVLLLFVFVFFVTLAPAFRVEFSCCLICVVVVGLFALVCCVCCVLCAVIYLFLLLISILKII